MPFICELFARNNSVSELALYSHSPIKDPGFLSAVAMVTAPWIPLHSYRSSPFCSVDMNSPPLSLSYTLTHTHTEP